MDFPNGLWALLRSDGRLMPPIDDDGTDLFMVWRSKEDAEKGLLTQTTKGFADPCLWEVVCILKPELDHEAISKILGSTYTKLPPSSEGGK